MENKSHKKAAGDQDSKHKKLRNRLHEVKSAALGEACYNREISSGVSSRYIDELRLTLNKGIGCVNSRR